MPLGTVIRLVLLLILLGGSTPVFAIRPHPEQNLYNRDFRQVMSGRRTYDPVAGMWLSYDPQWNEQDPNYLTFCGGDPINGFDADGRVIIQQWQQAQQNMLAQGGAWNYAGAMGISAGYAVMQLFSLGNFARNDMLADQNLAGQISGAQMYGGMAINTGVGLASVAVTGGTASLALQSGKVAASFAVPTAFVAGGATVGVGSQAAQDVLFNQQMSSLQTYENDAVAGGVGGLTTYFGGIYAGGAAGGLTKSLLTQSEAMTSGQQPDFNYWQAIGETGVGAIPGLFGTKGFYSSVEQQILTKMANGTIQNVAASTAQNIFANEVETGLPSIGVDVTKEALSSLFGGENQQTSDLYNNYFNNGSYIQGPLGGKH